MVKKVEKIELLAPAGDFEKLETALHFGADAVYFAGKNYGLRAYAANIEDDDLAKAVSLVHKHGKKAYVTLNIFAHNKDFENLAAYLKVLVKAKVDAVIVSDIGMFSFIREHEPSLVIHVSTQANTTNAYSANMWAKMGAKRIILARELSLTEIEEICKALPEGVEVECFVHGAMCISYSGRCLLSNYLTGRDSNHGECVQACRWHYSLVEDTRPDEKLDIEEDSHGAYILNSKDLCLIDYLDKLKKAGVTSFKVEGRMKSPYYVATVINAYRRAINLLETSDKKYVVPASIKNELNKASHRKYTTGFFLGDDKLIKQNYESASQDQESVFIAKVISANGNKLVVEQRNKFSVGDSLEVLSSGESFNKKVKILKIENEKGEEQQVAKLVQEKLIVTIDKNNGILNGDILRADK